MSKTILKKTFGVFMSLALILTAGVFTTLNVSAAEELDYKNLENGNYTVNVVMKKAVDKNSDSMANRGVNPVLNIEVVDGVYYGTLTFMGIEMGPNKGYLSEFSYYDDGYTYDERGKIVGPRTNGEVLTVQKNPDGSEVRDRFNENGEPYPEKVKFPLVRTGINDPENLIPVHVLIPLMESFGPGLGQQDMLMKVDWTSLKKVEDEPQPVQPAEPVDPAVVDDNGQADNNNPVIEVPAGNNMEKKMAENNVKPMVKMVSASSPKTGDSTSFMIVGLGLLAVAGLGTTICLKKRNK